MREKLRKNKKILLVLLLLAITLGYALLSATLTINGSSKIEGQTWDIHWNNVQVTSGSVAIGTGDKAAVITPGDTTEVTYEVTLDKPGDFYEFTVDALNGGSVDAMIDVIASTYKIGDGAVTTITSNNLPAYLDYSVAYSDGTALADNQELKAGDTETYKVRVEYKKDIENNQLVGTDQSIVFSFAVDYVQKDDNAIAVNHQTVGPVAPTTLGLDAYAVMSESLSIGYEIPSDVNLRSTPELAMADWASLTGIEGDTQPLFLGYKFGTCVTSGLSNVPVEKYVGFVISDDLKTKLKNENCDNDAVCEEIIDTLVNGTYILNIPNMEDLGDDDELAALLNAKLDASLESNIDILKTAFGYSAHPENCNIDGHKASCSVPGLRLVSEGGDTYISTNSVVCGRHPGFYSGCCGI